MDTPFGDTIARYVDLDFTGYKPPAIVHYQKEYKAAPKALPFDPQNLVYDRELSAPMINNSRFLWAKYRLPSEEGMEDGTMLADLRIETPVMQPLFGLSAFKSEHQRNGKTTETTNYSLLLSFNQIFNNDDQLQFFRALRLWDQEIVKQVYANRQKWLPGVAIKSPESVELLFTGMTAPRKRAKDGQVYPPGLQLRIAKKGGQNDVTVIDRYGNPADIKAIQPSSNLRVMFRHSVRFQAKSIDVRNEAVLIQLLDQARPTAFANPIPE